MTLDKIIQQVDAEEVSAERTAIASIKAYDVERSNEKTAKDAKDKHGVVLRNWLLAHPDEQILIDYEWGLHAYMAFGGRTRNYEHPNVVKQQNPKLYARFEALGLLRFDDAAVQQAIADGLLVPGDLEGYILEGERTPTLQVKTIHG